MKVKELREVVRKYSEKEREDIIVALYNVIPKRVKENKDIDLYILNASEKKEKIKPNSEFNDDLISEMNYFIDCANEGLYARPNKILSKSERSSWRFKMIRFYKALCNVPVDSKDGELATTYLRILYHLLCVGSETLVFSNWDTFNAIKVSQLEYLDCLLKRELFTGFSEENLVRCIKICMYPTSRDFLSSSGLEYLFDLINDLETKLNLIKLTEKEIGEYKLKAKKYSFDEYRVLCFAEAVTYMYMSLRMINEGISYLSSFEKQKEIVFYIVFNYLKELGYYEEWIELYNKYKYKIKFRDSIIEDSKKIKEMI